MWSDHSVKVCSHFSSARKREERSQVSSELTLSRGGRALVLELDLDLAGAREGEVLGFRAGFLRVLSLDMGALVAGSVVLARGWGKCARGRWVRLEIWHSLEGGRGWNRDGCNHQRDCGRLDTAVRGWLWLDGLRGYVSSEG